MRKLVELTNTEFDIFTKKHIQGNYLQSVEMKNLLLKRGKKVFLLGMKEDDVLVAAVLLFSSALKVGYSFSICGGPLLDYSNTGLVREFLEAVKLFAKKNNGLVMDFSPNLTYQVRNDEGLPIGKNKEKLYQFITSCNFSHNGFDSGYKNANPQIVYVKELNDLCSEKLIQTYHPSTRTKVNKAIKSSVIVKRLARSELPEFDRIMKHTASRQSFSDKGLSYYEELFDSFGEKAHFMVAEINFCDYYQLLIKKKNDLKKKINCSNNEKTQKEKIHVQNELQILEKKLIEVHEFVKEDNQTEILAAGLFIESPQEMVFLFGGMYSQYKKILPSSYYLQHIMMQQAINKKIFRFNFYGIEGNYTGNDGVLNFKKGFGGIVEEQMGVFTSILQPVKYKIYQTIKRLIIR